MAKKIYDDRGEIWGVNARKERELAKARKETTMSDEETTEVVAGFAEYATMSARKQLEDEMAKAFDHLQTMCADSDVAEADSEQCYRVVRFGGERHRLRPPDGREEAFNDTLLVFRTIQIALGNDSNDERLLGLALEFLKAGHKMARASSYRFEKDVAGKRRQSENAKKVNRDRLQHPSEEEVVKFLDDDWSPENVRRAGAYFVCSEKTINRRLAD